MQQFPHLQWPVVIETIVYVILGLVIFGISLWFMEKITPFSIRKEIVEDQNVALALIMASIIFSIALILASALV